MQFVGCLYIPGFPAWALAWARRESAPVVVVSRDEVIACTRRATQAGIEPGMRAERAGTLLPSARIFTRNVSIESAVWEEVLHELNRLTPFIEEVRRGLVLFRPGEEPSVRQLVNRLGIAAGMGPSRTVAHLAAVRAAAGNVIVIEQGGIPAFLAAFPTESLAALAFEEEMIERLRLFGYRSLGALSGLTRHHMEAQFGPDGARLYRFIHPPADPPMAAWQPPPVVTTTVDLEEGPPADYDPVLRHLIEEAFPVLGNMHPQRMRLLVRHRQGEAAASRILAEPTREEARLRRTAHLLLGEILAPEQEPVSILLELGALHLPAPRQHTLFSDRPSIYEAVRAVHRKFPGAIVRAIARPHALLPEERTHYEPFPEKAPLKGRKP